jgi:hypothetical protein
LVIGWEQLVLAATQIRSRSKNQEILISMRKCSRNSIADDAILVVALLLFPA